MIHYLIPARKGSKGFPGKNRILFGYTAVTLKGREEAVIVSTDDSLLIDISREKGFNPIYRPAELASDEADIIGVMKHAAQKERMKPDDIIVLLYLVHPLRKIEEIDAAIEIFRQTDSTSLACRFPAKSNPYKCIYEDGSPVVDHGFYRRQDFPACYEIMHYVAIYKVSEIEKLNKLAYNENTTWLDINEPVDIDLKEDFNKIQGVKL